jgi:hypothetical protein
VIYYFSITSASGPLNEWVPLTITASGTTAVGQSGAAIGGGGFNNNRASASISVNSTSVFSACSGYGCALNEPSSFNGSRTAYVLAYSNGIDTPAEHRVTLTSSVSTNSNYEHSFAHSYVDPVITIDPAFLAAHPDLTLSFSANIPTVPLPGSIWLMMGGMAGLVEVRRRQRR